MEFFRVENNVPKVYENESRDFQLVSRLYDLALNDTRSYIDRMLYVLDTNLCNSNMIKLLQTKLGFFTTREYSDETLRYVLLAFPYLIRNKGSMKAIRYAINMFLKLNKLNTMVGIRIDNTAYEIEIGVLSYELDTSILDDIFRYILPTGYIVKYSFYNQDIKLDDKYSLSDGFEHVLVYSNDNTDYNNSWIRGSYTQYQSPLINKLLGTINAMEIGTGGENNEQ